MAKKESVQLISKYNSIFSCPICTKPMELEAGKSLVCTNNHCFDLAKQGYVNLLTNSVKTKYDKNLFNSRKIIAQSGFFDPLNEQIVTYIEKLHGQKDSLNILDAGCGEGSHLSSIQQEMTKRTSIGILGVGFDIAKEGIISASKNHSQAIWCVADLAKSPFASKQFNIILNILSPSNYSEFNRLLVDDGNVIKVVPSSDYLKELREAFYKKTNKEDYSNDKTIDLFRNHLELIDLIPINYTRKLDNNLLKHLINMTPLSWSADKECVEKVLELESLDITIDLSILIGRKKAS